MADYIDSDYLGASDTNKQLVSKSSIEELLDKPIDDSSLQSYGVSKPKRVILKARVIHDPS